MKSTAQSGKSANADLIPIYAELEQTSFLQPVIAAKKQSGNTQAKQASKSDSKNNAADNNEKPGAQNSESQQASALPQSDQPNANSPEVVNWVEGEYSYIGLNVNDALAHLQTAKQDLNNNESGKADLELARAQQSVDAGTVEVNMPLVRARENIALARDDAKKGNLSGVKTELKAAAKALKNYAHDKNAPHANEAKNIYSQINSALSGSTQPATSKIDHWWNQVADWTGMEAHGSEKPVGS